MFNTHTHTHTYLEGGIPSLRLFVIQNVLVLLFGKETFCSEKFGVFYNFIAIPTINNPYAIHGYKQGTRSVNIYNCVN